MSLTITLITNHCDRSDEVYSVNIPHNLDKMAKAASIYKHLWEPETIGVTYAHQLIDPLIEAIKVMAYLPDLFRKFDSSNGWGSYDHFLRWLLRLLEACVENREATIRINR